MALGIQVIGTLFGIFMVYYTFLHFKRKEFTLKEFGFWFVFWLVFIYIALFPAHLDFFVKEIIQLKRPLDFFIIMGFMFLIGIMFYIYAIVRKDQNKLQEIVRKMAIEKAKK